MNERPRFRDESRAERWKNLVVAAGAVLLFLTACIVITLFLANK